MTAQTGPSRYSFPKRRLTATTHVGKADVGEHFATRENLKTCFLELPPRLSGKEETSSVRPAPPEASSWLNPGSLSLFCGSQCARGRFFFPFRQCTRGGLFDEKSDGLRLRHINGVAAFDLDNR
jgi:hypothetical protein